jgi:hypothetical protein
VSAVRGISESGHLIPSCPPVDTTHRSLPLLSPHVAEKKSSRPRHAGKPADRAAHRPLRNTPPVAQANVRLFAELFGDPQVHAARWFVCTVVLGCVVVALALAIARMLPLKRVVPYAVEHTPEGIVTKVVAATAYTPTSAVLKSEMAVGFH